MLLKSITLHNFRQFRDTSISFARGENGRNVTIIKGENGSGKTTLARAFQWCLYGLEDQEYFFQDKVLLSKAVAKEMSLDQKENVKVIIEFTHGDVEYTLIREQMYQKNINDVSVIQSVFNIVKKDKSGNSTRVPNTFCFGEVQSILPKELFRYFFFDGERIEKMSKDISSRTKSEEFAKAVAGLLGLAGIKSAITHLSPNSTGVIGSYDKDFDSQDNQAIADLSQIISNAREQIASYKEKIDNLDSEIDYSTQSIQSLQQEIKKFEDGEKLQNEKEKYLKLIEQLKKSKATNYKSICKIFNTSLLSFFSKKLTNDALVFLNNEDFTGKDIPHIHAETIDYLLGRKTCLCGTCLAEGTLPFQKLVELKEFLPPKSISNYIGDFKREAHNRVGKRDDMLKQIKYYLELNSDIVDNICRWSDEIEEINKKLGSDSVHEKVRNINCLIREEEDKVLENRARRDEYLKKQGEENQKLIEAENSRRNLALKDKNNKQIEICRAYAMQIYKELQEIYSESEEKIRKDLQNTINEIFKQVFGSGLSLVVDDKYHISVYADDYDGKVETSTAQSISVFLAFISGVIKIAKENRNAANEEVKLLSSEPYPLVMDAPLSAFDKKRIKTVCDALSKIAEQVIIFIKDTDGDLAEQYLGASIGCAHRLNKINEMETILE